MDDPEEMAGLASERIRIAFKDLLRLGEVEFESS
jgi:hypothetical protein